MLVLVIIDLFLSFPKHMLQPLAVVGTLLRATRMQSGLPACQQPACARLKANILEQQYNCKRTRSLENAASELDGAGGPRLPDLLFRVFLLDSYFAYTHHGAVVNGIAPLQPVVIVITGGRNM